MTLYFAESGNKAATTIVFIHGGGVSGWIWQKQVEYFRDYHCLTLDLPEHGKSVNTGLLSLRDSAYQIADLIEEHANGSKAHVVGHSLGAKVLIELLIFKPELIVRAIVASALFKPLPVMKLSHKHSVYKLISYLLKFKSVAYLSAKQYGFPDKTYEKNYLKELQGVNAEVLYRIYDELYQNLSLPKGLEDINVPTLLIAGEKEPKAMKESVVDMLNIMSNAKGLLVKNGLHTYPWARYDEFNKIVEAWINDQQIDNEWIRLLQQ